MFSRFTSALRIGMAAIFVAASQGCDKPTSVEVQPVPDPTIKLTIVSPMEGEHFAFGERIPCSASVVVKPQENPTPRVEFVLDGAVQMACSEEFLTPAQPASSQEGVTEDMLSPGPHTIRACARSTAAGEACAAHNFVVDPEPVWVSYIATDATGRPGDVFLMNLNDGSVEPLTSGMQVFNPLLSPDGSKLAFTANVTYMDEGEQTICRSMFVANRDGSNPVEVSGADCASGGVLGLDWYPSGDSLAYVGGTNHGPFAARPDPFVVHADGSGRRLVPTFTCDLTGPANWEPPNNMPCVDAVAWRVAVHPEGVVVILEVVKSAFPDGSWERIFQVALVDGHDGHVLRVLYEMPEGNYPNDINYLYEISPDASMVSVVTPGGLDARIIRTDGTGAVVTLEEGHNGFQGTRQLFWCGDNEWLYYRPDFTRPDFNTIRKIRVDGTGDTLHTVNKFGHLIAQAHCAK